MNKKNFKEIFAKLIELKEGQVLITKNYKDGKQNPYALDINSIFQGISFTHSGYFSDEESRDKAFDEYNENDAQNFFNSIKNLL